MLSKSNSTFKIKVTLALDINSYFLGPNWDFSGQVANKIFINFGLPFESAACKLWFLSQHHL